MTQVEFLLQTRKWCMKMLSTPEAELPGTLTYEKVGAELERVENELIDHIGVRLNKDGQWEGCYIDSEKESFVEE